MHKFNKDFVLLSIRCRALSKAKSMYCCIELLRPMWGWVKQFRALESWNALEIACHDYFLLLIRLIPRLVRSQSETCYGCLNK